MAQSKGPKLIRSMAKGLQCLAEINRHSGLTVSECGALVGLPRTTAFRVLETLCRSGYVYRGPDGSYRATSLVRTLSNGFDDEEWVNDIAMPEMNDLGARLHWSVGIATPNDLTMIGLAAAAWYDNQVRQPHAQRPHRGSDDVGVR